MIVRNEVPRFVTTLWFVGPDETKGMSVCSNPRIVLWYTACLTCRTILYQYMLASFDTKIEDMLMLSQMLDDRRTGKPTVKYQFGTEIKERHKGLNGLNHKQVL